VPLGFQHALYVNRPSPSTLSTLSTLSSRSRVRDDSPCLTSLQTRCPDSKIQVLRKAREGGRRGAGGAGLDACSAEHRRDEGGEHLLSCVHDCQKALKQPTERDRDRDSRATQRRRQTKTSAHQQGEGSERDKGRKQEGPHSQRQEQRRTIHDSRGAAIGPTAVSVSAHTPCTHHAHTRSHTPGRQLWVARTEVTCARGGMKNKT
jgi:hypothetical protein